MRQLIRHMALSLLGSTKSVANGIHILNSHYISRANRNEQVFHDLLRELNKQADFVKIEDAVDLIQTKKRLDEKLIAFTFDDGFEECYSKVAPVLEDFNTNAAFFINPGYIDGNEAYLENFHTNVVHVNKSPMTWEQIKDLHKRGHIIGNHTYDHVRLVGLNEETLNRQVVDSKRKIETALGATCAYFAWTYGSYKDIDEKALQLVQAHHNHIFSCDDYQKYHWKNPSILNRRHIEGDWPTSHVKYFLSKEKQF